MGRIGMPELIVVGIIIIFLFGVKKLPEIGSALGKAIREFRKAGNDANDENKDNEQKS